MYWNMRVIFSIFSHCTYHFIKVLLYLFKILSCFVSSLRIQSEDIQQKNNFNNDINNNVNIILTIMLMGDFVTQKNC